MTTITIALPDERVQQLKEIAERVGVTPEELLRAHIEEWLSHPEPSFAQAVEYVLHKNAELYRRLA
ncbi:MAG: ribbon-helix-helix domain-containing protein [Armatimonadota bacterium]|nr:ribbon-helix-helix domain-containing protein [Armatimonadota bacterium]